MGAKFVVPVTFTAHDRMSSTIGRMESKLRSFNRQFKEVGSSFIDMGKHAAIAGAALLAPLLLAANSAIKFEDRMADVGKTTGLAGQELSSFGDALLQMSRSTRTSLEDLTKIGEIGGQLGVAKAELLSFVEAANKFNVALGADYGGAEEAIQQVGKLKNLFKDTRDLDIAQSITRTGSVINELGAVGAGTSANINDFMLRIGQLPEAIKPSLSASAALGTFFEEVGVNSEIASGGFSNLLLVATRNIGGFARQMHMTSSAAKELLANNPTAFALNFASSLNGLKPDELGKKLHNLQVNSQESIKVIGALGSGTERLTELQELSNKAFEQGTSLQSEYDKKNSTTAAKLAIAQNNFQALSITIGTQLVPVISDLLDRMMPVIESVTNWIKDNPELAGTIVEVAAALGALSFVLGSALTVIGFFEKAIWLVNIAMTANPVGAIIIGIAAMIALIVIAVNKWDEWGAALMFFMGPIGWIIELIQSFRKNWDIVARAFKTDGILGALKAIGKVFLDAILYPLQQILEIASNLPGKMGEWAAAGAANIERFRNNLGVGDAANAKAALENGWDDAKTPYPARTYEALNPRARQNDAFLEQLMIAQKGSIDVNINAPAGTAEVTKKTGNVMPKVTSTTAAYATQR